MTEREGKIELKMKSARQICFGRLASRERKRKKEIEIYKEWIRNKEIENQKIDRKRYKERIRKKEVEKQKKER